MECNGHPPFGCTGCSVSSCVCAQQNLLRQIHVRELHVLTVSLSFCIYCSSSQTRLLWGNCEQCRWHVHIANGKGPTSITTQATFTTSVPLHLCRAPCVDRMCLGTRCWTTRKSAPAGLLAALVAKTIQFHFTHKHTVIYHVILVISKPQTQQCVLKKWNNTKCDNNLEWESCLVYNVS